MTQPSCPRRGSAKAIARPELEVSFHVERKPDVGTLPGDVQFEGKSGKINRKPYPDNSGPKTTKSAVLVMKMKP
jgi:hypothetical protein